jgi:DNA-binding SARP family transcriptional activator
MEFRILGPLQVLDEGLELTPRRAKQRVLLAALLLHPNEPLASDTLIEALWGERPPQTAQTALHGHVSALRKLLGPERILTRAAGYQLCVRRGELDAERFEVMVADPRAQHEPAERSSRLTEALGLWHGEPLADFRYEEFAQGEITRLEELRLAALEERAGAELALGRHQELLPELERLLAEQPLRERLRALVMLALYRAGRQSKALEVYQQGRQLLAQELGLDPGPALKALQRQILEHDPALGPPEPAEPMRPRQERKHLTVLVAEFVPTRSSDPEELGRLAGPALARARELIGGLGGTIQPLFANALVGIFGAPRAHEDDPQRAVLAAEALVEAIGREGRLSVRVGIERGEALVTIAADRVEVTGEVIAAASRLQASAPVDAVAVGPGLEAAGGRDAGRRGGPFVGRGRELELLERTYERAVADSTVQLVTVVGEPGSGKTRLARQLRMLLGRRGRHRWLEGRCLPYGEGVSFWALGEIVKSYAGILESDDRETSARKLGSALAWLFSESEDLPWMRDSLAGLVGLGSSASAGREESFAAWRRFLEALARHDPLVLLVEDLHWADRALLEFVDDLLARASGVPMVVLCTARLELLEASPGWSGGKRNATTLSLPPLNRKETREVARAVLDGEEPSEALIARAGGNPLFAQELARMEAADVTAVPESLDAVIAARLDTLAPEVKEAAMDAAVIGEVFWSGALAAVGATGETDAEERLRRLVANEVVRRAPTSSVMGQGEYAFLHVLVRDVAYGQIPKTTRARKHQAAAAWIEQLAGERVLDHAELIAHHYGVALALARDAGEDAPELAAKTSHFLVVAGDRAMQLDIATAERLYRRALELAGEDEERAPALLGLAAAAFEAGSFDEAIGSYQEVIAVLRSLDQPLRLGKALASYGTAMLRRGDPSQARMAALVEAVETLERLPAGPELAYAYASLAGQEMFAAHPKECNHWSEKAIELCKNLGLDREVVRPLHIRGAARYMAGDLGGLDDLRQSLRLGLDVGAGMDAAAAYVNLGEVLSWADGPGQGQALFEEGIDFCERRGLERIANVLRMHSLRTLFDLGHWDQLTVLADALAEQQARGNRWIATVALTEKASVLVRRGELGSARALIDAFLEPARRIHDPQTLGPALVCAALIEHAEGDAEAATRRVAEFGAATSDSRTIWRALWIADAARVCAATGALALAKNLVRDLEAVAPRPLYGLTTARAVLAEADGNLDQALAGYSDAAERWREFGNVVEEAYALFAQGRCLRHLGRYDEANRSLAAARRILDSLQAAPLIAAVDRHLANRTSRRVSDTSPAR